MKTEHQNKVWSILPKEFKEEVKKLYCTPGQRAEVYTLLQNLFGAGNLTSDAEGEVELLHVTRQKVMGLYANAKKLHDLYTSATCINEAESRTIDRTDGTISVLKNLFGSKCVPDEEPKPAEPKYRKGEKVRYNGYVYEVEGLVGKNRYALKDLNFDLDEDMIEPYTEPEENMVESRNLSQETANCDKEFDNILKDSFSKERRLNVAAMAMQGILAAGEDYSGDCKFIAKKSLELADALIAESELTDKLKGE